MLTRTGDVLWLLLPASASAPLPPPGSPCPRLLPLLTPLLTSSPAAPPPPQVLSDILGSEDALGDMDFKVAGSADAITAFQMDIKVEGITLGGWLGLAAVLQ